MGVSETSSTPVGNRRPNFDRSSVTLWATRGVWMVLPLLVGRGVLDAADGASSAVRATIEIGLWIAWFGGLVALLVPSTVSLTALRIIAVAAPVSAILAGLFFTWSILLVVAVVAGLLAAAVCLLPQIGDVMVNGSAYGSERRMALRPPMAVLVGPVQLAWLLVYGGAITGPLLVASGRGLSGAVASLAGVAAVLLGSRSLHQLSRRWMVFVPAGFVIHDYTSLAESLLFLRRTGPHLGLVPTEPGSTSDGDDTEDDVIDLSQGALGHPLFIEVDEALPVALRRSGTIDSQTATKFVFSPTLPGAALAEARLRAIRIG